MSIKYFAVRIFFVSNRNHSHILCFQQVNTFRTFAENPSSVFGKKLHEQVEDRLEFYSAGKTPKKNLDVMKEAIEELSKSAVEEDNQEGKKKKKKKDRKSMQVAVEEEDEEKPKLEASDSVSSSQKKKKKKKSNAEGLYPSF